MKSRITFLIYIFALSYSSVAGQTAKDIDMSYGRRENVYSVGEHLWMTPAYGADGQFCMMRIYGKRVSINTNFLDDNLDMDEVLKFINKLVPLETRGARTDYLGSSDLGGGVIWTRFNYDRVRLVFISTFRLDKLSKSLLDRPDEVLDFPIDKTALPDSSVEKHSNQTMT